MSRFDKENSKNTKKSRLGRGIGSLLNESNTSFSEEDEISLEEASEKVEIEHFTKAEIRMPKPRTIIKDNIETKPRHISETNSSIPKEIKIKEIIKEVVRTSDLMSVEKIKANKSQPRKYFNAEALRELSLSIREKGILQPIVISELSENSYQIIAGERRFRAAKLAGLKEVPVVLRKADEEEILELALIENLQRRDLNPIEEARAYKNLMDKFSTTQEKLGKRLGKNRASIANTMRLLKLSPLVQEMVVNERLSMGHAKVLLTISDLTFQEKLAKIAIEKKSSVRDLEVLIKSKPTAGGNNSNALDEMDFSKKLVKKLSEEIQKIIGTKVDIDYNKGKGKIKINYYSDEELNQFVDNLRNSWTR